MHEWAIAEGVAETALEVAQKEGLDQVTRVEVRIGELQQIKKEVFQFALDEIVPKMTPALKDTVFELIIDPAILKCRACDAEISYRKAAAGLGFDESESIHFVPELAHAWFRCDACSSQDFEVVGGRGVSLAAVEGTEPGDETEPGAGGQP
jgi:hydrogenase nickel incorporation protein HypA/HybF